MLPNIRFVNAERPDNWANIDQLAQIKVKIEGQDTYYFLYWHKQANMVFVQKDLGYDGPCYWACGKLSVVDMLTHFHGILNVHVIEAWAAHGEADVNTIADIQFLTIRNRYRVASVACEVA